jgi:hypothetical protein
LIANPAEFDGKHIRVCGYLDGIGPDRGVALYVSVLDARNGVFSNSIDLKIEDSKFRPFIRNYVILSGVFHGAGQNSMFNGLVDGISDITKWPPGDEVK